MTFCVVGGPHALTGYSHKVRIQFAVGILVVENRHRIRPRSDARKFADCVAMRDVGLGLGDSFLGSLREIHGRRKQRAQNMALVAVQSGDLNVD